MDKKLICIHDGDCVAVALRDLTAGEIAEIHGRTIKIQSDIPSGHKVALCPISKGGNIFKYGSPIGHATAAIRPGDWVHSHNLKTNLSDLLEYEFHRDYVHKQRATDQTFEGYVRADKEVGTRNEVWIIPTVSCVNHTAEQLAQAANRKFSGVCDGFYAFPHNAGCSQLGDDFEITSKLLANIVRHPNAGAVLLVSLGCENNGWEHFEPFLGEYDKTRIRCMITQEANGNELETGLSILQELAAIVASDQRQSVCISKLKIGLKCGGSDGFSGMTANPLCGRITDRITSFGGSAVLTEVPEMFGVETNLMDRAANDAVFGKIVNMINGFKKYYLRYDQPIYENPSPGNKAGGLTTLEEKSLGCIQKGGHAMVSDTLDFGGLCQRPGLNLMTGPGNDSVSITNLVSTGVQIILFTTGRGNPLGTAVPTVKIASNSRLAERKPNWIDFNAGVLLDGVSFEQAEEELWTYILQTASGKIHTKCEENGFREIMIFKNGVLL